MEKGTFRAYGPAKNLSAKRLEMIGLANQILDEFEAKGHAMTVRQLYYQFVARGYTGGENSKAMYDKLQNVLNDGRLQGLISWTALEDRGRNLMGLGHFESTSHCLRHARNDYRIDMWANQQWRPEVWIEKEALVGVIGNICNRLRVDFFACRGYNSQSEQWRAGKRFARYIHKGQRPIVFHLGDHDPSGIDMTRDNRDKISMFSGTPVIVQRLALNMNQIEELQPPPNYAKQTDSRWASYVDSYGELSWELDALDPVYIENLIHNAVLQVRDEDRYNEMLAQENADIAELDLMIEDLEG